MTSLPGARRRRLTAGALPLLAGIGLALALAGSAVAADAAPAPRCTTAGLVVWLDSRAEGAAGSSCYQRRG